MKAPVLFVRLGDRVYRSTNWSDHDLAVRGDVGIHDLFRPGNTVTGYFGIARDEVAFRFEGLVTRADGNRQLAAVVFMRLPPESRTVLESLIRTASMPPRKALRRRGLRQRVLATLVRRILASSASQPAESTAIDGQTMQR